MRHDGPSTAARNVKDAGLPKIIAGAMKRSAQESAGRIDGVNAARVADARMRLEDAERTLRDDDSIVLDLPDTDVPAGRTVVSIEGVAASRGGRTLFTDVDLVVRGPERIALTGRNGAGKSTLLRIIGGELPPDGGSVRRADGRVAYLSQRLDLLNLERTVAENLVAFAPNLSETRRMHLLAQFLFRGNRIHLPVARAVRRRAAARDARVCALRRTGAAVAAARRAHQQPRPGQRRTARNRAERLPGRVHRRQP